MIDKLPAMYLFTNDYITGTRTLSLAERGIYIDLLCFSQNNHGKGLPNNLQELAKMVLPFELNPEKTKRKHGFINKGVKHKILLRKQQIL